jgi:hypothetical protein
MGEGDGRDAQHREGGDGGPSEKERAEPVRLRRQVAELQMESLVTTADPNHVG